MEIDKRLQDWRIINKHSEEYIDILYKSQELVPLDNNNSSNDYYSDYNVNNIIYRLTWGIGDSKSSEPTIQRLFN
jgi:hypothetical protein